MTMKTFNITATMEEKHVDRFCSMLKYMENFDDASERQLVGFSCGGNRDFHPKFNIDTEFNLYQPMIDASTVIEYSKNLCHECGKKLMGFLSRYKLID